MGDPEEGAVPEAGPLDPAEGHAARRLQVGQRPEDQDEQRPLA